MEKDQIRDEQNVEEVVDTMIKALKELYYNAEALPHRKECEGCQWC